MVATVGSWFNEGTGGDSGCGVSQKLCPSEVFKPAILLNACAIIAVHNHPSGDPTLSPEDLTLTIRLREAGDLHGIKLLDHLILGGDRCYSFADQGWPL